jgi:hypothetical protein
MHKSTGFIERKAPFHSGKVFVCLDRISGAEIGCRYAGADHIDAVELGLGCNLVDLPGEGKVTIADVEDEVLRHLLRVDDLAVGLNRQPSSIRTRRGERPGTKLFDLMPASVQMLHGLPEDNQSFRRRSIETPCGDRGKTRNMTPKTIQRMP